MLKHTCAQVKLFSSVFPDTHIAVTFTYGCNGFKCPLTYGHKLYVQYRV